MEETIDREAMVYMAELAERSERFDEMVETMKTVAQLPQELTQQERNLLSVAYKNVSRKWGTCTRIAPLVSC